MSFRLGSNIRFSLTIVYAIQTKALLPNILFKFRSQVRFKVNLVSDFYGSLQFLYIYCTNLMWYAGFYKLLGLNPAILTVRNVHKTSRNQTETYCCNEMVAVCNMH